MRFPAILLVFALVVSVSATAGALKLNEFEASIEIDKDGYAHITEHYGLSLLAGEIEGFRKDITENSSSLLAWSVDYNWFYPHFNSAALKESYITFDETENTLVLDYYLKDRFAELVRDEPRNTFWKVPDRQFSEFLQEGTISIPETARITIKLPQGSVVSRDKLLEKATVLDSSVMLTGVTTNYISLEYTVRKPISAPLSAIGIIGETNIMMIAILIILVCAAVYLKREPISERIEEFVVEHSHIEPREETEEEIDVEA